MLLDVTGPGEKILEKLKTGIISVFYKLIQSILQIIEYSYVISLGSLHDTVEDRAGFCSLLGEDVDPVLAAKGKWLDGLFSQIVVHRHISI